MNFHEVFKCFATDLAAILPGDPMTPPPGCAPDPHMYKPPNGVDGEIHFSATGLVKKKSQIMVKNDDFSKIDQK